MLFIYIKFFNLLAATKYLPSKITQIIKSIIARELFQQYPELRNSFGEAIFGVMADILALLLMMLHQM